MRSKQLCVLTTAETTFRGPDFIDLFRLWLMVLLERKECHVQREILCFIILIKH